MLVRLRFLRYPSLVGGLVPRRQAWPHHTFFTNSDFSFMAPMPSILQSMSWSPSHRRMFFTLVPTFTTEDEPLTFRSLITVMVSPSCRTLPTESLMTRSSDAAAASPGAHSWAHSGQTSRVPSS